MAKGRRLTISLSERYLGSYNYGDRRGVDDGADASELGEEDIWSAADEVAPAAGADDPRGAWTPPAANGSSGSRASVSASASASTSAAEALGRRATGAARGAVPGPRGFGRDGGVPEDRAPVPRERGGRRGRAVAARAAAGVLGAGQRADWSKIYRVDSVESLHDSDDTFDDGGDAEMMPPHEYLARKGAAATSVCEGVGRTLKGRDARRIRDAVWSRTGFDG
ncbi:hypothetical protein BT93_D0603 [Corymbia citriodora subsp. variegata]|nr:hypothetical protein BT93_D0603 [Corymbia citriodora subsp. variegata]